MQHVTGFSRQPFLRNSDYIVKLPHLSLYHASLEKVPLPVAEAVIDDLVQLLGERMRLTTISLYHEKFLFWDAVVTDALRFSHERALRLAEYVDRRELAPAQLEGVNLTAAEAASLDAYGYPLAGPLFRPHITLAYRRYGWPNNHLPLGEHDLHGCVAHVAVARLGAYGSVGRIVTQRSISV